MVEESRSLWVCSFRQGGSLQLYDPSHDGSLTVYSVLRIHIASERNLVIVLGTQSKYRISLLLSNQIVTFWINPRMLQLFYVGVRG